ncbi:hypothetical protein VV02_06385 [Luteipulveratus mongoliensis]|uniref:Major facilitator superfamily (MFS) profile domain-containing protein n=2 Tax=Luteipulveratus mongoliensis TaxID=571913 RepID=A0A0K1JPP9_9MICO|nr:hypothetical protein VV02_06385 [Luteipulveratus mongoliensis]
MNTNQRWVLVLTSVASLAIMLDALVVTTALNAIRLDLNASIEQLEWTINAFTLPFAVLLMAAAALGDRFGRRRTLVAGLVLFGVASIGCALAPGIGWLIVARAVQGAGAAAVVPVSMTMLGTAFGPTERGRALGLFAAITGIATLAGPLLGGAVVEGATWPWIFWLNAPVVAVLIPLVLTRLEESRGPVRRLDLVGILLVSGAAFGLVWGLVEGNSAGWTSAEVLGALVIGAVLLVAFVAWERRVEEPLIPMQLFASRAFSAGNAAGFLLFAGVFSGAFFFAQFMQTVMHYGPLGTGVRLLPWTATLFVVAPIAGRLVNRVGERPLVAGGLLLQAIGLGWIAVIASPDMSYVAMIPPFIVAGVGVSMAIPAAQSAVLGAVPPAAVGAASGTFNTLRQLGGSFGIAIPATVFAAAGDVGSVTEFTDGFTAAIATAAVLTLVGAAAAMLIPARTRSRLIPGRIGQVAGDAAAPVGSAR